MNSKRIIFAGTPDFAALHLQRLIENNFNIVAVYTQPDRPSGRGKKLSFSPVKELALLNKIQIFQPLNFKNDEDINILNNLNADLMIVVAYGLILPQLVLKSFNLGCINVHASLLPRWRGAAPIARSILNGDKKTGICLIQMDQGLDTGDILIQKEIEIEQDDNSKTLHDKLAFLGGDLLIKNLNSILDQKIIPQKQSSDGVYYAHKLLKEEAKIDFSKSSFEIYCKIRAFYSFPVANFQIDELVIKVYESIICEKKGVVGSILDVSKDGLLIACKDASILITKIQFPGGKILDFAQIFHSKKVKIFQKNIIL